MQVTIQIGNESVDVDVTYYQPARPACGVEPPEYEEIEWETDHSLINDLMHLSDDLCDRLDELVMDAYKNHDPY